FLVEIGVVALGGGAQAMNRGAAVVLHGDLEGQRLAGGDAVVLLVGANRDLEIVLRRTLEGSVAGGAPVDAHGIELAARLAELALAHLLDEAVQRPELVFGGLARWHARREIAREADREVELELVLELAAALAQGHAVGLGEVI